MTALEILVAGRARIVRGWTRGWFAKRADGSRCEPSDPEATCLCAIGAIRSVAPLGKFEPQYMEAFMALKKELPEDYESVAKFNDNCGSAYPVLELYDRAIASVQREAAG